MGKEIHIRDLSYSYGGKENQLRHIHLDIRAGEVVVLTGPSGSGKSSLTRVINGLIPYFFEGNLTGEVLVDAHPMRGMPAWERGKLVGNVFQDPRSQFFANEVAGEIAFGCENYGFSHEEIRLRVNSAAESMQIEDILDSGLRILSYGMRQKVAIASAEALAPEIYVMDEPSANLDMDATWRFGDLIADLKRQGKTVIIAEHRLYYLMDIADRFVCIRDGTLEREYSRDEMRKLPNTQVESLGLRAPDLHQITFAEKQSFATPQAALTAKNLCKSFDGLTVADHINLTCRCGETVAVIGPNGTGKSTLGKILSGLLREDSGDVLLFGKPCKGRRRLGKVWYIPQDLDSQIFGEDLMDELMTGSPVTAERKERAQNILSELDLSPYASRHPATLSGGQKQRLALGVALMHDAPVIILDEPTSGLDGTNMRKVSRLLRRTAEKGRAILVITHDAECAMACCERAIRLEQGRITDDFAITSTEVLLEKIGYGDKRGKRI